MSFSTYKQFYCFVRVEINSVSLTTLEQFLCHSPCWNNFFVGCVEYFFVIGRVEHVGRFYKYKRLFSTSSSCWNSLEKIPIWKLYCRVHEKKFVLGLSITFKTFPTMNLCSKWRVHPTDPLYFAMQKIACPQSMIVLVFLGHIWLLKKQLIT